jgi:hypothetical protein
MKPGRGKGRNRVAVDISFGHGPRVGSRTRQPRASRHNPFGIAQTAEDKDGSRMKPTCGKIGGRSMEVTVLGGRGLFGFWRPEGDKPQRRGDCSHEGTKTRSQERDFNWQRIRS